MCHLVSEENEKEVKREHRIIANIKGQHEVKFSKMPISFGSIQYLEINLMEVLISCYFLKSRLAQVMLILYLNKLAPSTH